MGTCTNVTRIAKIFPHINQCKGSVQYFPILHAVKETCKTGNTYTAVLIRVIKCRRMLRQSLHQLTIVAQHMHMVARQDR